MQSGSKTIKMNDTIFWYFSFSPFFMQIQIYTYFKHWDHIIYLNVFPHTFIFSVSFNIWWKY